MEAMVLSQKNLAMMNLWHNSAEFSLALAAFLRRDLLWNAELSDRQIWVALFALDFLGHDQNCQRQFYCFSVMTTKNSKDIPEKIE